MGKVLSLEKKRVTTLVELVESIKFVFEDTPYEAQILVWKKSSKEETKNVLEKLVNCLNKISVQDWTKTGMESRVGGWMKENEFGTGNVLWPMRVALSGQKNSPGPFEIAEVLGKEETIERLRMAIKKLE